MKGRHPAAGPANLRVVGKSVNINACRFVGLLPPLERRSPDLISAAISMTRPSTLCTKRSSRTRSWSSPLLTSLPNSTWRLVAASARSRSTRSSPTLALALSTSASSIPRKATPHRCGTPMKPSFPIPQWEPSLTPRRSPMWEATRCLPRRLPHTTRCHRT